MNALQEALTLSESVQLGYVFMDRLARQHDLRLLAIKGPVLEQQGLRAEHQSIDVDVWVDPDRLEEFGRYLSELGWIARPSVRAPRILEPHSTTFGHPLWPCEIDVHDRYPGMLVDRRAAFEAAWARRGEFVIADQEVVCTDSVGSACIAALHYMRMGPAGQSRLDDLIARVAATFSEDLLETLRSFADDVGALTTLETLLLGAGAPTSSAPRTEAASADRALRMWRLQVAAGDSPLVPLLTELGQSPLRRWPTLILHTVWLPESELRKRQTISRSGPRGLGAAWLRRAVKAVRSVPFALRVIWSSRRS